MENKEKKLTKNEIQVENLLVTDALETFNILLKVKISEGLSIADISAKTGISKQALYRYSSQYDSQKKIQPSVLTMSKLCAGLGYEMRINKMQ